MEHSLAQTHWAWKLSHTANDFLLETQKNYSRTVQDALGVVQTLANLVKDEDLPLEFSYQMHDSPWLCMFYHLWTLAMQEVIEGSLL